jgi:hypothetical protein
MNPRTLPTYRRVAARFVPTVSFVVLVAFTQVESHGQAGLSQPAFREPTRIKVGAMENVSVTDAKAFFEEVLPDISFTPWKDGNRFVVRGTEKDVAEFEQLLAEFDQPAASAPTSQIRVFSLKNTDAEEVASTVSELMGGVEDLRISVDYRTNSIVVTGDSSRLSIIEGVIKILDTNAPVAQAGRETRVLELKHTPVTNIAETLRDFFDTDLGEGEVVLTPEILSNTVLISGTPDKIEAITAMVQRLDVKSEGSNQWTIRCYWFLHGDNVSGGHQQIEEAFPTEMAPGVRKLMDSILAPTQRVQIMAKPVIIAGDGVPFEMGFATHEDAGISVQLAGMVNSAKDGHVNLKVQFRANQAIAAPGQGQPTSKELLNFDTSVITTAGHLIALCGAPVGDTDSALLIQVLPLESGDGK